MIRSFCFPESLNCFSSCFPFLCVQNLASPSHPMFPACLAFIWGDSLTLSYSSYDTDGAEEKNVPGPGNPDTISLRATLTNKKHFNKDNLTNINVFHSPFTGEGRQRTLEEFHKIAFRSRKSQLSVCREMAITSWRESSSSHCHYLSGLSPSWGI